MTIQEELFDAIFNGDRNTLQSLLDNNIDKIHENGMTPLHYAAYLKKINTLKFISQQILKKGLSIDIRDIDDRTALHYAAEVGCFKCIKYMVEQGANINATSNSGTTALHYAAANGHISLVKYLIDSGIDAKIRDIQGANALRYAQMNKHRNIAEYLMQKQIIDNEVDDEMENNKKYTENTNDTNYHSEDEIPQVGNDIANTYSHNVYNNYPQEEILPNDTQNVKGAGTKQNDLVSNKDSFGISASQGLAKISKVLPHKLNPLHYASITGNLDVVKNLIMKQEVNVNAGNKKGASPIHYASFFCYTDIVEFLINQGANIDPGNNKGINALHYASINGCTDVVRLLVEKGANINIGDVTGNLAIHYAAANGHEKIVEFLADHNVEILSGNNNGVAPLHYAAINGHKNIVQFLLSRGASTNAGDSKGITALHYAAANGQLEVFKFLIDSGAKIKQGDTIGMLPTHYAVGNKQLELVQYLLKALGCDLFNIENNYGVKASEYANEELADTIGCLCGFSDRASIDEKVQEHLDASIQNFLIGHNIAIYE